MSERFLRLTEAPLERGLPMEERVRRHRLRFVTPVRQPAVLVSQVQRSGGTLVSQLLDGHSALHVHPSELHIGRPTKYVWPDLDRGLNANDLLSGLREKVTERLGETGYQKQSSAERLVDPNYEQDVLPFMFAPELQRDIFSALVDQWGVSRQRSVIDAYMTSYFNAWIDYQGAHRDPADVRYWAAFVPRLAGDVASFQRFSNDYPEGKLVTVVRDPVSWFASARRHSTDYENAEAAALLWRDNYSGIRENARSAPDKFLFIGFEQLVSDTEAAMRRLCAFLDIAFEPCLLHPTFNGLSIKSDSSFGGRHGVDKSAVNRRNQVSADETAAVTRIAMELYDELHALTR